MDNMRATMVLTRQVFTWAYSLGALTFVTLAIGAENYPTKPIRFITTEVGGGSDLAARLIAQGIAGPLGHPVIVENRGGGATISGEIVAKATPDGYTLLIGAGALWIGSLLRKTPYDTLRDFAPISLAISTPNILITHPSVANSVKELVALAKSKPGQLNYGSGGSGASSHLAAELFKSMAGINMVRIPYKGSGLAVNAVIANEVQLMFPNASLAIPHVKSGRLKALGVTSADPSSVFPGVPTVAASGLPGYESVLYTGLFAPAKTPPTIIKRLHQDTARYLKTQEVKELFLKTGGSDVVASTPEQFTARIKSEVVRLGKLIKDVGITAE
jgi:tripartite-type tricarboxylate transporter receptor subunit TctC